MIYKKNKLILNNLKVGCYLNIKIYKILAKYKQVLEKLKR